MTTTIPTDHTNELILVDDVLDPRGSSVVALGLINQDGSDTFPGRTLTPDQAEELAASLAQAAAAARATAGSAATPLGGEQAYGDTLKAIRAAVPLTSTAPVIADGTDEQADASASPPAAAKAAPSPAPSAPPKAAAKAAPSPAPKPTANPARPGSGPEAAPKPPCGRVTRRGRAFGGDPRLADEEPTHDQSGPYDAPSPGVFSGGSYGTPSGEGASGCRLAGGCAAAGSAYETPA
jgi:hypothetical protein